MGTDAHHTTASRPIELFLGRCRVIVDPVRMRVMAFGAKAIVDFVIENTAQPRADRTPASVACPALVSGNESFLDRILCPLVAAHPQPCHPHQCLAMFFEAGGVELMADIHSRRKHSLGLDF